MSRFKVVCTCGWELGTNDKEEMLDLTALHDKKCRMPKPKEDHRDKTRLEPT